MYIIIDNNYQSSELMSHKEIAEYISKTYGEVEIDEYDSFKYDDLSFTIVRVPNSIKLSKVTEVVESKINELLQDAKEILDKFGLTWNEMYLNYTDCSPLLSLDTLEEDEKFLGNMIKIEVLRELKINL